MTGRTKPGLIIPPLVFVFLFLVIPLGTILVHGLTTEEGRLTAGYLGEIVTSPYYLRIIGFTLLQAALSTLFAVALGLPGAYFLSHVTFPGKRFLKALATVPFVLPPILVVLGFILVFGNNGFINRALMEITGRETPPLKILYSLGAIILAHGFYNFPIAMRVIGGVWERRSLKSIEAARTLGAGRFAVFRTVTLPQILPGVLASSLLIFLFCYLSFAVILVLGGGPEYTTVEVEIYRLAKFSLDFRTAGALAVIQSLIAGTVLAVYSRLQKRESPGDLQQELPPMRMFKNLPFVSRSGLSVYGVIVTVVVLLPLFAVVVRSFFARASWTGEAELTLKWYRTLFAAPSSTVSMAANTGRALGNTLILGLVCAFFSVLTGTTAAYAVRTGRFRGLSTIIFMLPMGISTVMLGFGYLRIAHFLGGGFVPWLFIVAAHTVIAYPFVYRTVQSILSRMSVSLTDAARTLGASRFQAFRTVDLPLMKNGLVAGGAFAFALSAGEMNATIMIAPEGFLTAPLAVYRLIGSYNFFGACALGSFLVLMCLGAFYLIDRLSGFEV